MTGNVLAAWPYLRTPVAAAYVWWAATWALVAFYYLRSGQRQWRQVRGAASGNALLTFVHGVLMMCLGGLLRLWQGKFSQPYKPEEMTHTLSMTLQQGIICSSMCTAVLGVLFYNLDRSSYTPAVLGVNMFCIMLSTVGAMIHLFPPMRIKQIVLWRLMMLWTWLGMGAWYAVAVVSWRLGT